MAVLASTQSGLWSAASTWGGVAAPAAGDVVTITAGHAVTFDVDMSGWASGVNLTINGTLDVSTTVSTVMRSFAQPIRGTGIYGAGTSSTPLPRAIRHTIDHAGRTGPGAELGGGLRFQFYCWEPAAKLVGLTASAAAGATVLPVTDDVSAQWDVGAEVYVCQQGSLSAELRTIAAISATSITLTAGLSAAKATGSRIVAVNRNIRVLGATNQWSFQNGTASILGCEIGGTYGVYYGSGHTITGPVSGCTYGVYYGSGHTITGPVSGCTYGVLYGSGHTITGPVSGCTHGVYYGSGHTITGPVSGCTHGVLYGSGHTITGPVSGCTYGVYSGSGQLFGCVITSSISAYLGTSVNENTSPRMYLDSRDHGGVAGERRTWSIGGYTATDLAPPASGPPSAQKMTMQLAGYPCYIEETLRVEAGRRLRIGGLHKLGQTGITQRPRVQIINPASDPLAVPGAVPLAEFVPVDNTDWQPVVLSYLPPSDGQVIVRWVGQHAIANAWWNPVIPDRSVQVKRADGSWAVP